MRPGSWPWELKCEAESSSSGAIPPGNCAERTREKSLAQSPTRKGLFSHPVALKMGET